MKRASILILAAAAAACGGPPPPASAPGGGATPAARRAPASLPPVPPRTGTLAIDVVYPGEGQALAVRDSNFIFGNVGTGGATLTIGGAPVEVAPNGAFLAFLPVPADGRYDLRATAGGQRAQLTRTVRVPAPPAPAAAPAPARDSITVAPVGPTPPTVPPGPSPASPRVAVAASASPDRITIGTAIAGSGTPYNWFFPTGARLAVEGVQGSQYRVRLTDETTVWVDTAAVDLLPEGAPPPRGFVGTVTADPEPGHLDIRLSLTERLPFRVEGTERGLTISVYGAETRTNILQYGATDPLLRRMDWEQVSDDLYRLSVELSEPLWGFYPRFDERGNLVVRVYRTPEIDPRSPLRGIHVVVDPGHPPGGTIGPTRYTEAEATLALARRLVPMLTARGARVTELRTDMAALEVGERVRRTLELEPDLFLSLHFDAFGDGTDPFRNYGTHVLFNQPQSLDLARAMQAELLLATGLPDLGVRRQDVAVIRNPMMPAVLTETMFMMFPQQEASLRDPDVLDRIANAHVLGLEAFLRARAR